MWIDPRKHDSGRAAVHVFKGPIPVLIQHFLANRPPFKAEGEDKPDEQKVEQFIKDVQADHENPKYHLYCYMYTNPPITNCRNFANGRWLATGRKPMEKT